MRVVVGEVVFGEGLAFIGGPCVIEDEGMALRIAGSLRDICAPLGLPFVFKASFDKANRTSAASFRGPGLRRGLEILARVRREVGVPVTTDIHLPQQAPRVAEVVDLLQIPAFLCRQTDLLQAAAATGRPVNLKKGQFLAPRDLGPAMDKAGGPGRVLLTDRGTSFGYGDLVADLRCIPIFQGLGAPAVFDCTHAVQQPGAGGNHSGGQRAFAPVLARAAVAAGADAIFAEVHEDPDQARSDAATQLPLDRMEPLLRTLVAIRSAVSEQRDEVEPQRHMLRYRR